MKIHCSIAVVALVLPTLSLASYWESPYLKSFDEAQAECAQYQRLSDETVEQYASNGYPDDNCVRELVHCSVLNVNAWNETTGIKDHVIRQFFVPSPSDSFYQDRTQECLRETVACLPNHDQIGRAYKSFLCYYRNYGNVAQEQQFVPFKNSTRKDLYKDAICIKSVPRSVVHQFANGDILNTEQFSEVYYAYVIRTGLYDPEVGINFERTYAMFGNPQIISEKIRCCETAVRRQYHEEPKRLVESFKQCLQFYVTSLATIQEAAQELIEETPEAYAPKTSPPSCSRCGAPAPCKTCGINDTRFNIYRPCYNGQCN